MLMLALVAYLLSVLIYPFCIRLLRFFHIQKTIRINDATWQQASIFASMHGHKSGTPTMGWVVFLIIVGLFMIASWRAKDYWLINYDFFNAKETGLLLVWFFGMGVIGLLDDIFNILKLTKVRWLAAWPKLFMMFAFAWWIAYWFVRKLNVFTINIRPLGGEIVLPPIIARICYFLFILFVTNAINITDGLDGLAWWLLVQVFSVVWLIAFLDSKFLTSGLVVIVLASVTGFLWHNIHPAKIFMGDSGSFSLGWLLAVSMLLLNIEIGVFIPFVIMFGLFTLDAWSSLLQILRKKRKKEKLFPIAPIHHYLEYRGMHETTIVMKRWLVQAWLNVIGLMLLLFQLQVIG